MLLLSFAMQAGHGMTYEIARISLIGDRPRNEDCVDFVESAHSVIGIVADGLGGHANGHIASQAFTRAAMESSVQLLAGSIETLGRAQRDFAELFRSGASAIAGTISQRGEAADSRTTAAMAMVCTSAVCAAHIGDSRVYRLDVRGVVWRSKDHSLVQWLVDSGEIPESEMGRHPDQGILHRAIGGEECGPPSVEFQPALCTEEAVLLCTDGFWEYVDGCEMSSLVRAGDLAGELSGLAHKAVERAGAGGDNVTALCVRLRS